MRWRLVKTGKSYADDPEKASAVDENETVPPIIWETGNSKQIRSLLVLRQAELVVAKTHLTGDLVGDWYVNNRILDLEKKIDVLKRWLAEATLADPPF